MAQLISVTVVGKNSHPQDSTTELIPTAQIVNVTSETKNISTANATIYLFNGGYAGAGTVSYTVTETEAAILSAANVNTTNDLANVGTFSTTGFATFGAGVLFKRGTAVAINSSATIASGDMTVGYITSTSAAPTTITLRTATQLATELGATAGSSYRFIIDNSAGASTVTLAVATGVVVGTTALTGGDSLTLSTAQAVGVWELIFKSTTTAQLRRVF